MKMLRCVVCANSQEVEPSVIQVWCLPCSERMNEEARIARGRRLTVMRVERRQKRLC